MHFLHKHPTIKNLISFTAKSWLVSLVVISTVVTLAIAAFAAIMMVMFAEGDMHTIYGDPMSPNKLLSIKISGVIVGDDDDNAGLGEGTVSGYAVKQKLAMAAERDDIKGVILEINSPGGTIYGARAITEGIEQYREQTKKPVIAYIQGLGASGAYWAAAGTDEIIADYGSEIGSIGVLVGPFMYYDKPLSNETGILTANGIQTTTITAGKNKDTGNPYRRLTTEEIANLQRSVDNDYKDFVDYVAKRRGIDAAVIRDQYGALGFDNKTAAEYKLINGNGSREAAYGRLAAMAKLENDYTVIRPKELVETQNTTLVSQVLNRHKPKTAGTVATACLPTTRTLAFAGNLSALCQ